ncbi:nitric oxide reductase activation protein [Paenibacillus sp. V4I5]|nr:nitric oxide reductase activation protein [Paenibacillus sp. V4I5]
MLQMQLVDLGRMFTKRKELEVEAAFHADYEEASARITVSQFWRDYPAVDKTAGMKSDVYLRGIGSAWFTGADAVKSYLHFCQSASLPKLANTIFALCEDMRLERICRARRPGTARVFAHRHRIYRVYFQHKLRTHLSKGELADAVLLLVYGWFTGLEWHASLEDAGAGAGLSGRLAQLYPILEQIEDAAHTAEVAACCETMMDSLSYWLDGDATAAYFWMQPGSGVAEPLPARYKGELKRAKRLANDDVLPEQEGERQMPGQERMPTWHRESSDRSPGLLRFELERGSRTAAQGSAPREGDASDQVLAIAQGRSMRAGRTGAASGERRESAAVPAAAGHGEGAVAAYATATWLAPERPTAAQEAGYRRLSERAAPLAKPLQRAIRRTLEQKRIAPRGDRLFGRLDKRLTRAVTQEMPRLFYKKRAPVPQLDAAFALLVDCSASMYDKMDETKLGLVLFHETLRSLRIPHEIVGFWEDADRVTEKEAPNLFQVAVDFGSSLASGSGAALLQLEPQQDNRDGFAIRRMTERLLRRTERQRILLVFSDGEPSAANYNDVGILDTYEAVLHARRQGIEVISVFLASGAVHETERIAMRNMYGRSSIVVPNIEELAEQLVPILRKLLLKSIF